MPLRLLKKMIPNRIKHGIKLEFLRSIDAEIRETMRREGHDVCQALLKERGVLKHAILDELYSPWEGRTVPGIYSFDSSDFASPPKGEGFPIPPTGLRMGYYEEDSEEVYVKDGKEAADRLKAIYTENGGTFDESSVVLDWGCASGRVLRHFGAEARAGDFWGADPDEHCILWNKENLSPPFRFVTSSAYPHLPFEDNTFTFVYGISVFTHLLHFADTWLLELKRVTRPGGHVLLTVHTEASVDFFEKEFWPYWLPRETDLDRLRNHDMTALAGGSWRTNFPFFRQAWLQKEWGLYLDVVDIRPAFAQFGQTAVLLKKPLG